MTIELTEFDLKEVTYCKCCGFDFGQITSGNYWICDCCYCETECHDCFQNELREYRADWVEAGMPWRDIDYNQTSATFVVNERRRVRSELKETLERDPRPAEVEEHMKQYYKAPPEGWNPIQQMLKIDPIFY